MKYTSLLKFYLLLLLLSGATMASAQNTIVKPTILYTNTAHKYVIGGINLYGAENLEPSIVIGLSGLSVGDVISVPGDEVTSAVKRFWKHGLFEDVSIAADSIVGDKIFLGITLKQRPRVSQLNLTGISKSEREDLELKIGIIRGNQITADIADRATRIIKKFYADKGYKNAHVVINQRPDATAEGKVIVDINIDKKEKVKINRIYIEGTDELPLNKVKYSMKKTREKVRLDNFFRNLFRSKKFNKDNYKEDKDKIISLYNEHGYRDARIVKDSVVNIDEKHVDVYLTIDEGRKYHIRDIKWVGNSVYSTAWLDMVLRMKAGDVYNQPELEKRLFTDEDALKNLYYNDVLHPHKHGRFH